MMLRISYSYSTGDDLISSSVWDTKQNLTQKHLTELLTDINVVQVWVRDASWSYGAPVFLKG